MNKTKTMKKKKELKQEIKEAVIEVTEASIELSSFFIKTLLPLILLTMLGWFIISLGFNYSSYYFLLLIPLIFVISVISTIKANRGMPEI